MAGGRKLLYVILMSYAAAICLVACAPVLATPANRAAFSSHFGTFLAHKLDNCAACHQSSRDAHSAAPPTSLAAFPHNSYGDRLRTMGIELRRAGKRSDIPTRLTAIAREDSDHDGVDNQTEILLGHNPGDPNDKPSAAELERAAARNAEFAKYLASYRWQPFEPVRRPAVPVVRKPQFPIRNPIDAFVAAEHEARGLKPRPPASRAVLLRRVTIDLTGLAPTTAELEAFERDSSPNAYERVVDRLLASPRYGERWGRHWMDVWRYSDWAGWGDQVRDSKPFIWRWRDWIVESLNKDKGYDRMVLEMLAADELCPEDTDALRATGFLVRNFKLLSREQWMEDTMNHTSRAFLGVTMGCAKCHDHMYDPLSQQEYYRLRAVFEPHNVRTDRIPGQPDTTKDGLVHAFDADLKAATYFYPRGDERNPDKSRALEPGVPASLGGTFTIQPVKLPVDVSNPDMREFVIRETVAAVERAITDAKKTLDDTDTASIERRASAQLNYDLAIARRESLMAVLQTERLEDGGDKSSDAWKAAAIGACAAQRTQGALEAKLNLLNARKALADAGSAKVKAGKAADPKALQAKSDQAFMALAKAEADLKLQPSTNYKPRSTTSYPAESTGRRLAFARWLVDSKNPLVARVAVNHIWARHFGQGIVPSLSDFGRNGRAPSNPQLLDWLASVFSASGDGQRRSTGQLVNGRSASIDPLTNLPVDYSCGWSMKKLHRLIVTSSAYRMASTPDEENLKRDPDNRFAWRMSSRRLEAEAVRDNMLYSAGQLDETMGGSDVDHNLGLVSRRRSIYLRIAAEKEVEFLKIFDSPSVTECYERKPSVMPQQALALANSELAIGKAKQLADLLSKQAGMDDSRFIEEAFIRVLTRRPTAKEKKLCGDYLAKPVSGVATISSASSNARSRENLVLVLFNHNDFVTVR